MSDQDETWVLFHTLFSSFTFLFELSLFRWTKMKGKVEWVDSSLKVMGTLYGRASSYFLFHSIFFFHFLFFDEPKWENKINGKVECAKDSSLKVIGKILWASILCTSRCSSLSSFSINLISVWQKGHNTLFTFLESFISSLSFEVTQNNFKHWRVKLITWHDDSNSSWNVKYRQF